MKDRMREMRLWWDETMKEEEEGEAEDEEEEYCAVAGDDKVLSQVCIGLVLNLKCI